MQNQISITLTFDNMAAMVAFMQARVTSGAGPKPLPQEPAAAAAATVTVAVDPFAPSALDFTRDVVEGALKPYSVAPGNQLAAMMAMLGGLGIKTIPDLAAHPKSWAPIIAFTKAPGADTAAAIKAAFA